MKKLLIAFAAAGTLGIAALASSTGAEAKWGGHGFSGHHGGFHHGGHGIRHFGGYGYRHWGHGYRHNYGYRWGYGIRTVGVYSGGSCWRYRYTPYGYKYVNVCVRSIY